MPQHSQSYVLAPAPGVQVTLTLFSGTLKDGGTAVSAGSLDSGTTSPAVTFTIVNDNIYPEGLLTIKNSSLTNTCHIDFFLDGRNACWQPHPLDNDNASALPSSPNTNGIGVGNPTDNGGGTASRYQVLHADMVYLVDYNPTTGNMLFRGNLPFTAGVGPTTLDQVVDFDRLHTFMSTHYKTATGNDNFPTKSDYALMNVSLISKQSEGQELLQEFKSYGATSLDDVKAHTWFPATPYKNPAGYLSQVMWWQLEPNLTQTDADKLAKNLSDLMNTKADNGVNIYYCHCTSGHDRTALATVSFLMAHREMPLSEAFVYGTTVNKLSAGMKNAQIIPDADNMGTTTVNANKSRIMPIAAVYNNTLMDVCSDLGGTNCTISSEASSVSPAYVYPDFPWAPVSQETNSAMEVVS